MLAFLLFQNAEAQTKATDLNILVFSKTGGFRHKSIPDGIAFLKDMGSRNHWKMTFSEDSLVFNESRLAPYDVIVFLNTTGKIFSDDGRMAIKKYFKEGKGFVGIHAASDTEKEWDWFTEMIGATFKSHPKVQTATLNVNTGLKHPAIKGWGEKEVFKDEWYNFLKPVGKHVNVLASVDEDSYEGEKMGIKNHPICWYHIYDGSRVFYTGIGHTSEIYKEDRYFSHVEGGILWAAGISLK